MVPEIPARGIGFACARRDGLLLCPEGAATLAAYHAARREGSVEPGERVVPFHCATGLKYPLPPADRWLDKDGPIDFAAL